MKRSRIPDSLTTDFLDQYISSTRRNYRQVLTETERIVKKPLNEADHKDLLKYRKAIQHQAPATVARKLSTLRSLYAYRAITRKSINNPTSGLRSPKVDRLKSVKWLTDDEVRDLLRAASGDARSLAIVWLALHGLRVAEIVALNVEQYRDGVLWNVEGKGGKARNLPLSADANAALRLYIGPRRFGPLIRGTRGRLGRRRIQTLVYQLTESVGHRVSIHALRHTYATRAVKRGVQTLVLAKLMGHESPMTTQKYVNLNTDDLVSAAETIYPTQRLTLVEKEYNLVPSHGGRRSN